MGVSLCIVPIVKEDLQAIMLMGVEGGVHGKLQYLLSAARQYYPGVPTLGRIQSLSLSTAFIDYS